LRKIIRRRAVPSQVALSNQLHPVLRRVFAARDVVSDQQLDYRLQQLAPFEQLRDIDNAVNLLINAICHERRIMIAADYDADGATACAVAIRGLSAMGAAQIGYVVPDRFLHGYGLTPALVDIAARWQPDLLVTVDSGIADIDGVRHAKSLGIKVIITDHHLPSEILPDADAIVNPNQFGDHFPSKNLAGVGVMFYVLMALRAKLRQLKWFERKQLPEPNLAQLLDLVALGTVADVVPLDYNNRILVSQGLARIRSGQCSIGIQALINISKLNQLQIATSDIAFSLAPRLNAAGRMDNMGYGIECLLNDNLNSATQQARLLDQFNKERKTVQAEMQTEALQLLQKLEQEAQIPRGICLYQHHWHAGILGPLAGRIKDRLHRPVILFAPNIETPEQIKGSARSIEDINIRNVLTEINAQYPDLILGFGGHAMAAGLTLLEKDFELFQSIFEKILCQYAEEQLQGIIHSDGNLTDQDFNVELATLLKTSAAWGQGFPEPLFDGKFRLLRRTKMGEQHLKLLLQPENSQATIEAVAYNTTETDCPLETDYLNLAYRLDFYAQRGNTVLRLKTEYIETCL
jgi:single-stranded-DNA-specific exonuclease